MPPPDVFETSLSEILLGSIHLDCFEPTRIHWWCDLVVTIAFLSAPPCMKLFSHQVRLIDKSRCQAASAFLSAFRQGSRLGRLICLRIHERSCMKTQNLRTEMLSLPPRGAKNVRFGKCVVGPGGRWVPCVLEVRGSVYLSSLFEVGAGRHQVCMLNRPTDCIEEAITLAVDLARTAAA